MVMSAQLKKYSKMSISDVEEFHINSSLKKIGISYKLQPSLLKQEVEHDEIFEDTWEAGENNWSPYVKNDIL